eukprot:7382591-Prymnesium_polylepis.3
MPSSQRSRRSQWLASFCAQPILVSCNVSGAPSRQRPAASKTWRSRSPTIRSSSVRAAPSFHMGEPPTRPSGRISAGPKSIRCTTDASWPCRPVSPY